MQIFFDAASLTELLQTKALHPILRAAADQQVLRVVAAQIEGDANAISEQLEAIGIRVYPASDGSACDYLVSATEEPKADRLPGTPGPTALSFETFGQYLRKMV
ncbi:MAG: hypothetical protein NXI24_19740 [bacterium]|nr:hypothetical protein [bacterium]